MKRAPKSGFAMVAVLVVLMALFVLSAPFLMTVSGADRASTQSAERAASRLALDSAQRHARALLGATHPALDSTPYFDSLEELEVSNRFPADFLEPTDERGVMWDVEAQDLAGFVDLNSAPPQMIANLVGGVARLTASAESGDTVFEVSSADGFLESGFAWVEGELVAYAGREASRLTGVTRGLGVREDSDGNPQLCGPSPARRQELGAYVIDQRAHSLYRWRVAGADDGDLRSLDAVEQLVDALPHAMAETLGEGFVATLVRTTTAHGGVGAGEAWQAPVRILEEVDGEPQPGCVVTVSSARAFNAGTLVRISDGRSTEYALVRAVSGRRIRLSEPLRQEYSPLTAVIQAQARRPVNVNTAGPEVLRALFLNLKLTDSSARITPREADELVRVVAVSRPFTGFEDFLRRVVLPAGGFDELPDDAPVVPDAFLRSSSGADGPAGFLDPDDARALYYNARNANDARLAFSTMPLSFTSRGVHRLELRAAVNAPSGLERTHAAREQVESIVPQRELLAVWARQEDFDEAPRLSLAAPGWLSGPEPTGRYGAGEKSPWPSRTRAHLGPHDAEPTVDPRSSIAPPPKEGEQAVHTFASREETGWIQPAPARTDDQGLRRGNVLHFDDETEELEGRYLPDGALQFHPGDFSWAGTSGWLRPLSFEAWIKPRDLEQGARFLDVGGLYPDSDSVSLSFDQGDLVLRVLDGAGDHPASPFVEAGEVRYSLSEGPGLPVDTWTHLEVGVAGNRPDQMRLLVDGRWPSSTPGLTRLKIALTPDTQTIPVESTDGFPERCTIRIGDELIEVQTVGDEFRAVHRSLGEFAGFGGRLARERYSETDQLPLGLNVVDTAHPAGAPVQLYGYSLPLRSNVPSSGGTLGDLEGPFGVARATGIRKGGSVSDGEDVAIRHPLTGNSVTLGKGMKALSNDITGIRLESVDPNRTTEDVMKAFSPSGGYAAIFAGARRFTFPVSSTPIELDDDGQRLGGIEVVRYSGWQGDLLFIDRRGDALPELKVLATGDKTVTGKGSFVMEWTQSSLTDPPYNWDEELGEQTMVIPISIPVRGAAGIANFLPASAGGSEFAQITHLGETSHLTEWVRYDEIVGDQLVRDSPLALKAASRAGLNGFGSVNAGLSTNVPATSATGPRAGGGVSGGASGGGSSAGGSAAIAPFVSRSSWQSGNRFWSPTIGEPEVEIEDNPVTRAVASAFQFRGVMGTYSHSHTSGGSLQVLPVWRAIEIEKMGQPGRFDHVFLQDGDPSAPAFPAIVHHAHRPFEYLSHSWKSGSAALSAEPDESAGQPQGGFDTSAVYVALAQPLPIPFSPSQGTSTSGLPTIVDTRTLARVSCFPSGERPRETTDLRLGGSVKTGLGKVPSAVVDEVAFLADTYDQQLVLEGTAPPLNAASITESEESFSVREVLRTPSGEQRDTTPLVFLPKTAGLLRMGDEILCYESFDVNANTVRVAPGGRGLLGTNAGAHVEGEGISFLESWRVTTLTRAVGASTAQLPVESTRNFPSEGTVLIGEELIHYTHIREGELVMPRASDEPGARDRQGAGLFRGRYGTTPASHAFGTPVILFPFRYWDRWSERADAPELHYHGLSLTQPDAYWRRSFWDVEPPVAPGSRIGVLQRTDASQPWDADPELEDGLDLFWKGNLQAGGNPIGGQSDRLDWRIFVEYEPRAFDAAAGLSHGWKATPRLRLFGAEYMGPGRVYRRLER